MDIQMKSLQKKAETSNEIVKYLNLELENYKETYHIFGANIGAREVTETSKGQSNTINVSFDHGTADRPKNNKNDLS